jgi:hypothetical protein
MKDQIIFTLRLMIQLCNTYLTGVNRITGIKGLDDSLFSVGLEALDDDLLDVHGGQLGPLMH